MANYEGAERTNYVRIRQEKVEWVEKYADSFNIEMFEKDGAYCFTPSEYTDDGCFNTWREYLDAEGNECEDELDLAKVALCMEEGQVLVILSSGHEKLRYISGWAAAWDWRGNCVSLGLSGIYMLAAEKFDVSVDDISRAEY